MKVERLQKMEQIQHLRLATVLELGPKQPLLMQLWMTVKIAMMKSTTSNKPRSCHWRMVGQMIHLMWQAISQRLKNLN